jgi:drug/metabolite transporter (DMT)-like permease
MGLALGYALNNHLVLSVVTAADPGTINLVNSSSSVLSAFFLWRFADRRFVRLQWIAVSLQMMGIVMFSQVSFHIFSHI